MPLTLHTQSLPGPHGGARLLVGATGASPQAALILLHGRGASAEDIASIVPALGVDGFHTIAPDATGSTWYPQSFLAPGDANRAGVDSAHALIESLIAQCAAQGVPPERVALLGFSQGACLTCDHGLRFPRRYGALIAFTGGVIGPLGSRFEPTGDLAGTPVFLGANDPDPHVPWSRVEETAGLFRTMGANVDLRRYPLRPHAVLPEEIEAARSLLRSLTQ